jgi:hypothetical protein
MLLLVGTRISFYVTPSQTGQILAYQIDNYSDTMSEFFYTLERNMVIFRLFETLLTLWIQLVIFIL